MKNHKITIQVSKTVQTNSYEPVTVTLTESVDVDHEDAEESKVELYKGVTRSVKRFIDNEVAKYTESKK